MALEESLRPSMFRQTRPDLSFSFMRLMLQSFICPQLSSLSFTEQFAILADDLSCERSELFGKKLPLCRKTEGCWVPDL